MRILGVLWVIGCGGGAHPLKIEVAPITMAVVRTPTNPINPIVNRRPYRIGIESVEILRSVAVRREPKSDAAILGIINKGTHAGVIDAVAAGRECGVDGRWIAIAPRGWVCENAVEPSEAAPTPATDATFDDDGEVPNLGVYGLVRGANATAYASSSDVLADAGRALAGSNTVRAAGIAVVGGHRFWRTTQGQLIDEASIVQLSPSRWKGVAIADPDAMPAWVRPGKPIKTYATPSLRGAVDGELAARTVVTILEQADGFARVSDTSWVERRALRVATVAKPPEGTGPDEKWFDIDRDEQVLVAYEGERPVYATLVSTGKYQHETPTSIARIASKLEHAVMTSDKESVYSVADVPWTMYYDRDFALHTSYWHDGFGSPRNLSPRDARILYRWSSPDVPPGWTAVYGDMDHPGSLVRVRTARDPNPAFRGYARTMHVYCGTRALMLDLRDGLGLVISMLPTSLQR